MVMVGQGIAADQAHRISRVGAADIDLIAGAPGGEHPKRMGKGAQPFFGHSRRYANHVRLLDPAVVHPFRIGVPQAGNAQRGHQVRGQRHDPRVRAHTGLQCFTVSGAHLDRVHRILFFHLICHIRSPPRLTAFPPHPGHAWPPHSPRPIGSCDDWGRAWPPDSPFP